jgi:hypothetical protein
MLYIRIIIYNSSVYSNPPYIFSLKAAGLIDRALFSIYFNYLGPSGNARGYGDLVYNL